MHKSNLVALVVCLALAACHKKPDESVTSGTVAAANEPATKAPAPDAEPTRDQLAHAKKQAALDYATMEDSYLNDPHGQWAREVTATSTFGDSTSSGPGETNKPRNIAGKPDGKYWTNDHQDMGFDSFEGTFEKPVHATEVRAVVGDGISAVTKVELKDTDGKYTTVWTGINEDPREERGPRNWFVRKFAQSTAAIAGVKITFANSVDRSYKTVDALQLVGE